MKKTYPLFLFLFLGRAAFSQEFEKLLKKGDEYYTAQNYPEAINYFTQAIQADAKNSKGYWYRGDAYNDIKNHTEAVKDYSQAIEIEPTSKRFYKKRGDCYYNLNRFALAEKDYGKGLEINNKDSILWLYRGDCYAKMKDTAHACSDYQKAYELGEKSGRSSAKELGCQWVKSFVKPCPSGTASIDKIEVDPFTGAVFILKGLGFETYEFKPKDGVAYITGPQIGKDESFVLKVLHPTNFCQDADENVFVGTGFKLYDEKGVELAATDDIYEDSKEGIPSSFLKSLSITLSFNKLETGKNYLLKVRFFDKRGHGEIWVEMPFKLASKTELFNNILFTEFTLGDGIKSGAVETEVKKLTLKQSDTDKSYKINLEGITNTGSNFSYRLRLINDKGIIATEENGQAQVTNSNAELKFTTGDLAAGNYIIWLKLQDNTGKNIGFTIPMYNK